MDKVRIFAEALQFATHEERQHFLTEACGTEHELRAEIDALLAAHDDAGSFLQQPPAQLNVAVTGAAGLERRNDDSWKSCLEPSTKADCIGTLGTWDVVELIGRGGMGIVLRALDSRLNRVVAIKMLAPELALDPVSVRRFLREAQAAAAVSHDHVVTLHAVDETNAAPIIVMECINGKSLQQKIDVEGTLDLKSILRIGMQTAAGLAAAHRQGLVHRDIKPANILLENGVERVKLTDFGLARAVDDISMTRTGAVTGTPQYMSPEQAQGQPVDHRTDLFSLGCVLYAMCTGRAAFRAESAVAVLHCVVHRTPRPITETNEDVPPWLCAIVGKLLAKDPDARFESALQVEEVLRQHLIHLQQPEKIAPQPALDTFDSPAADVPTAAPASAGRTSHLPGWFLIPIRGWMICCAIVIAAFVLLVANSRSPEEQYVVACTLLLVACPVAALVWFLQSQERRSQASGTVYGGYAMIVAAGLVVSIGVPYFVLPQQLAVIIAIVSALATSVILHTVRSQAFQRLRHQGGETGLMGEIAAGLNGFSISFGWILLLLTACGVAFAFQRLLPDRLKKSGSTQNFVDEQRPVNAVFAEQSATFYASGEPRDPVVAICTSDDSRRTFAAFRGLVSSGFISIRSHNKTETAVASGIRALASSPGSVHLAWVGDDGKPHLLTSSGRGTGVEFEAIDEELRCVAWLPDGQGVVAGSDSGVYSWSVHGGPPTPILLDVVDVRRVAVSSFGDRIATIDGEGLHIWNSVSEDPALFESTEEYTSIEWSADGSHLVTGNSDGSIELIDASNRKFIVCEPGQYASEQVTFSPDNIWIASAENQRHAGDHRIRLIANPRIDSALVPMGSSEVVLVESSSKQYSLVGLAFAPDGKSLVTANNAGGYCFWKFDTPLTFHVPNGRAPFRTDSIPVPNQTAEVPAVEELSDAVMDEHAPDQ